MNKLKILVLQLVAVAVGAGLFALFLHIKQMPGNLVPLSLFGIAIVDSIILTLAISGALTCWAFALSLFKAYFE